MSTELLKYSSYLLLSVAIVFSGCSADQPLPSRNADAPEDEETPPSKDPDTEESEQEDPENQEDNKGPESGVMVKGDVTILQAPAFKNVTGFDIGATAIARQSFTTAFDRTVDGNETILLDSGSETTWDLKSVKTRRPFGPLPAADEVEKYPAESLSMLGAVYIERFSDLEATGVYGNGYENDGQNAKILSADLDVDIGSTFSLEAWCYLEGNTDFDLCVWLGPPGNTNVIGLYANTTASTLYEVSASSWFIWSDNKSIVADKPLTLKKWTHLVVVASETAPYLDYYIDGKAVTYSPSRSSPLDFGADTKIHIGGISNTRPLDGKVDDIVVYNRALSAEEVRLRYERAQRTLKTELRVCEVLPCTGEFVDADTNTTGRYLEVNITVTGNAVLLGADVSPIRPLVAVAQTKGKVIHLTENLTLKTDYRVAFSADDKKWWSRVNGAWVDIGESMELAQTATDLSGLKQAASAEHFYMRIIADEKMDMPSDWPKLISP